MPIKLSGASKFEVSNKANNTAEILLYGPIGDSGWDDSYISDKAILKALRELPKNITQIDLRVNSGGGSVFHGTTIYELIKAHPANVTAYVEGLAASIASIIIMAADEIVMGDAGMIMLHKPLTAVHGNANEMQSTIDILDQIEMQMINIYRKKMKTTSREDIANILSKETWYAAEAAIEAGLADRMIDTTVEARYMAASIMEKHMSGFRNMPKFEASEDIQKKLMREELNSLTDGFNNVLNNI